MYETKEEKEKVILVKCALSTESDIDIRNSIDELEELANTAGAEKVGEIIKQISMKKKFMKIFLSLIMLLISVQENYWN